MEGLQDVFPSRLVAVAPWRMWRHQERSFTKNFFNPQEIPLETYTPEQIFERGEFELNRKRPQKGRSISLKSSGFIPIPNGPNAR